VQAPLAQFLIYLLNLYSFSGSFTCFSNSDGVSFLVIISLKRCMILSLPANDHQLFKSKINQENPKIAGWSAIFCLKTQVDVQKFVK